MKILIPLTLMATAAMSLAQAPSAEEILKTARYVATLQQQDLQGHIRKDGRKIPIALYLRGQNIQFQYFDVKGKKWSPFHMRLQKDHYDLFEMRGGKTFNFPSAKIGQAIEGTDVSYEDLALHFLYWPNGIVEGSQVIKGQDTWQVRLVNRTRKGRYAQVQVWVHKKSGALMQVVGYNAAGRPLKRFQVTDIMKVGNAWTLRRMRVDSVEPNANKVIGLTYLEFERPKAAAPGGLR